MRYWRCSTWAHRRVYQERVNYIYEATLVNETLSPVRSTPLHKRLLVALTIHLLGLNLIYLVASNR